MSDETQFQKASKPMGKSVVWTEAEMTANPEKKIYLGKRFTGVLDGRDTWTNGEGKEQIIYRLRMDDGSYVSVWSTAVIKSAMEEGNGGHPVVEGSKVRFTHMGMKKSPSKGNKPYHDILVEFAPPSPQFQSAGTKSPAPAAAAAADPFND